MATVRSGGRNAVVSHGELDPHRLLARVFFEHFGAQPRDASDDEDQTCRAAAGKPRSMSTAASAPSMFSGSGLIAVGDRRLERPREADAVASEPCRPAPGRTAPRRADRWSNGRGARSRAAALSPRSLRRPVRPRRGGRDEPCQPARGRDHRRSTPCSPSRRRRARRQSRARRRRLPPESDWRLPDAASRAAAQDGAPAP